MELAELLSPEAVIANLKAATKKQALQDIAARAAKIVRRPERELFEALLERERLGTTGVGQGVAIPHAKFAGLERLYGVFARLEQPIDFEAIDDRPVDLIFALLAPEDAGAEHLKALARVSRLLRNQAVCTKLRATAEADALYALLTEPSSSAAG
jgi:PTS system nitrogen regulatory IIA component